MYDLHAYARARQIEMEQGLRRIGHTRTTKPSPEQRSRGKLTRLFFGESPQSRAA